MDKEKQAFEEWCKQPDKTSKKDLDIGHMLAATAKEYQKSGRKIREILALAAASWHRGYKMGTETSNAEICRLKDEIETYRLRVQAGIEQQELLEAEIERLSQALILISNIAFAGKDYRGNWRDDIYSVCQRALTKHEENKT